MPARRPAILGHHLIWILYGHWLSNDPRGSGSEAVRDPKFWALGEAHLGRKPHAEQPARRELKRFYREAVPLLEYPTFWIDEAKRQAIGDALGKVIAEKNYTVWACAILSNHVHMVIRRHRDDALAMWRAIADATHALLLDRFIFLPGIQCGRRGPTKYFCARPMRCELESLTSSRILRRKALRHSATTLCNRTPTGLSIRPLKSKKRPNRGLFSRRSLCHISQSSVATVKCL